jgi:hypothetical protein
MQFQEKKLTSKFKKSKEIKNPKFLFALMESVIRIPNNKLLKNTFELGNIACTMSVQMYLLKLPFVSNSTGACSEKLESKTTFVELLSLLLLWRSNKLSNVNACPFRIYVYFYVYVHVYLYAIHVLS